MEHGGIILVLTYPLGIGLLFAVTYLIYTSINLQSGILLFRRHQFYLYSSFLFTYFAIILVLTYRAKILQKLGLSVEFDVIQIFIWLAACQLGKFLYWSENFLSNFIRKLFNKKSLLRLNILPNNQPEELPEFKVLVVLSILISFCEEFVWRGYLIHALSGYVDIWPAIAISSVFFGINHYYFGIEAIVLKSIAGIILGIFYVTTGNLWVPFIAHTVFNILFWKNRVT